ncbi:hypothetical protein VNI00_014791 [Paramarasmius palmivorus]|uniref:Uncharacterized protein n=1 Tax=Paramarasmius palmivorus TaxID=297713 RepID=A0AAW0BQN1_9AGAR
MHITAFVASGFGVKATVIVTSISAGLIAFNTIALSTLIVYQIFPVGHQVGHYIGPQSRGLYCTVTAATLESGIFYAVFLIITTALEINLLRDMPLSDGQSFTLTGSMLALSVLARAWPFVSPSRVRP